MNRRRIGSTKLNLVVDHNILSGWFEPWPLGFIVRAATSTLRCLQLVDNVKETEFKVMEQGTPVWDCELEMHCTA